MTQFHKQRLYFTEVEHRVFRRSAGATSAKSMQRSSVIPFAGSSDLLSAKSQWFVGYRHRDTQISAFLCGVVKNGDNKPPRNTQFSDARRQPC